MEVELKPCPFCGGKAELSMSGRRFVYCTKCRARACGVNTFDARKPHTQMAIDQWNRRYNVAQENTDTRTVEAMSVLRGDG